MNTISTTKSLFSQSIDLTDDYLSLDYIKTHSNNMFDIYSRQNDIVEIAIYHYGGDIFRVKVTESDTSSGCLIRTTSEVESFDNIYDAQDCVEDYLKDLLLDLGV
tara:strand:+ start:1179 stop:1493 length:315 start_codon:yes stop_codon:yes gene_type:complete